METAPSFDHSSLLSPAADTAFPCSGTANLKALLKELQLATADTATLQHNSHSKAVLERPVSVRIRGVMPNPKR